MELFEDFKQSLEKQNKVLMILFVMTCITLFISISALTTSRQFFSVKNRNIFSEELTVSEVCHLSLTTIKDGNINSIILSKPLIEGIRNANFKLNVEKVYPPIVFSDSSHCLGITRDPRGLRAFELSFSKSSSHPLGVLITDIKEIQIDQGHLAFGDSK